VFEGLDIWREQVPWRSTPQPGPNRAKPHQESWKPAKVFFFMGRGRAGGGGRLDEGGRLETWRGGDKGHRDAGVGVKETNTLVELGPFCWDFCPWFCSWICCWFGIGSHVVFCQRPGVGCGMFASRFWLVCAELSWTVIEKPLNHLYPHNEKAVCPSFQSNIFFG
jgi:hypothetical protein